MVGWWADPSLRLTSIGAPPGVSWLLICRPPAGLFRGAGRAGSDLIGA